MKIRLKRVSDVKKSRKEPVKIVKRILREDRKVLEKLNTGSSKKR